MLRRKSLSNQDILNISAILRDYRENRNPNIYQEAYKLYETLEAFGIKVEYMTSPCPSRHERKVYIQVNIEESLIDKLNIKTCNTQD